MQPSEEFFSDAGNAQLNILFQFFQYVHVIFANIVFQEHPKIEIHQCIILRSNVSQAWGNNVTTRELA
jgi:hypothetical protein